MKLNLKLFAVAAAVLAGTAARAGSTYDPITGELHDGGPSTIVFYDSAYDPLTGDLRDSRPLTEAPGYGALVVESTDATSEQVAGSGSGEPEVGTKRAQAQQDAEFLRNVWTMP